MPRMFISKLARKHTRNSSRKPARCFFKGSEEQPPPARSTVELKKNFSGPTKGPDKCAAALTALVDEDIKPLLRKAREDLRLDFVKIATDAAESVKKQLLVTIDAYFKGADGMVWELWDHVKVTIKPENPDVELNQACEATSILL
mmetsp:Transcript_33628/g.53948  ORF Transcript_33628/g.53948 Transcript_33628/m.53948 type:complete len:145 (-) Transcript_33628:3208-3642(-)